MPGQSQMESVTRGGSISDSWLEPKWKSVRSSSSSSIFACIGTSTTITISWYVTKVFINLCVSGRYCEQCDGNGACKKSWCIESQTLMPLATDKYSGNIFQFMKLEESMVGEDSKLAGMWSNWREYILRSENKIPVKILEFKRSRIGIITEFRRVLSRFPNQAGGCLTTLKYSSS